MTLTRISIPTTRVPQGIWYSTGKAFRMDKLITYGIAIPRMIPEKEALMMQIILSL